MTCRSLFLLLSSVLPSLAIGFWLAIALPSLSSSSHRLSPLSNSLACVTPLWVGVLLDALAAVVGMPSLSSAVNVARMRVPPHCMECRLLFLLLSIGYAVVGCRDGIINYYQLSSLFNSLVCVPPLCVVRRSLLSLLSSALPSSAVASTSPWLSSADVVARLARVRAAALRDAPLAALAAVVSYAVIGCRVGLAVILISCRCCSPRSVLAAALRGVMLSTLAAIVVVLSLSSAVAFVHIARVRTAAQCSAPLAAFTAAVSYAVLGCRVGLAVALINCHRYSPHS